MADFKDISIEEKFNEVLRQRAQALTDINKLMGDQARLCIEMSKLCGSAPNYEDSIKSLEDLIKGFEDTGTAAADAGGQIDDLTGLLDDMEHALDENEDLTSQWTNSLEDASEELEKLNKRVLIATQGLDGLVQQFRGIVGTGSFVIGMMGSIASSIFSIGTSILSIPFKIFGGLVDMAQNMGGGNEFATAREKVRQQFGDLSKDIAKNVMQSEKNMHGMMASGLNAFRVFGNRAEQLTYFTEMFTAMGNVAHLFGEEIQKQPEIIGQYAKGLGLSHEQMKFVGLEAKVAGTTLEEQLNKMTIASMGMAEKFGISHKLISRDMGDMMQDTKHYTSLTVHEMSRASVYVRKLGIEIKDVAGVLDKFDNFNDAAVATSNLSQAFGVTIDTLEMLQEQSPDKRIDMIRKAMAAAGQSAETMSRQQLSLLASNTGLDESTAKLAFSMKNQGVSMEELQKQQGKNEKKSLTQQEAMDKLANSIERLVKSGSSLKGGFFSMFAQGFMTGMRRSYPFRMMLRSLRRSLRVVYWAGRRLGRAFVDSFPGVMKMITAFRAFFNPDRFKALMTKIVGQFKQFFVDLKDPTKAKDAVGNLLTNIKKIFLDFFGGGGGPAQMFLDGFRDFGKALSNILVGAIKFAWSGLQPILTKITENLKMRGTRRQKRKEIAASVDKTLPAAERNKEIERQLTAVMGPETGIFDGLFDGMEGAFSGAFAELAGVMGEIISPIMEFFQDSAFLDEAKAVITDFFSYVFTAALDAINDNIIEPYGKKILFALSAWFIGGAVVRATAAAIATNLVGGIMKGMARSIVRAPRPRLPPVSLIGEGPAPGAGQILANRGWGVKDAVALGLKLAALAGALALGGVAIAYAMVEIKRALDQGGIKTLEDAAAPIAVLAGTVAATIALSAALSLLPANMNVFGKMLGLSIGLAIGGVALAKAAGLIKQTLADGGINELYDAAAPVAVLTGTVAATIALSAALSLLPSRMNVFGKMLGLSIGLTIGGVALANAAVEIKKVLDAGGITTLENITPALAILTALAVGAIPLAGALFIVSKMPLPQAALGAVALGLVLVAVAGVGMLLAQWLSGFDAETLKKSGDFMWTMTSVMLLAVPLVAAAAALGAGMISSWGLLAVAIIAGMTTLGAVVSAVAVVAIDIMKELEKMPITESTFNTKVDAFVKIFEVINKFAVTISDLMKTMQQTWGEFLFGGDTFTQKLDKATFFVEKLSEKVGGLAQTVVNVMIELEKYEIKESSASLLQVMNAVLDLTSAMTPKPEMIAADRTLLERIDAWWHQKPDETASKVLEFMNQYKDNAVQMMEKLKETVQVLSTINVPDPKSAEAVGAILGSLSSLLTAITPNEGTLKAFKITVTESNFGIAATNETFSTAAMSSWFRNQQATLDHVVTIIKSIRDLFSGPDAPQLGDIEKLKSFATIAPVIGELTNFMEELGKSSEKQTERFADRVTTNSKGKVVKVFGGSIIKEQADIVETIKKLGPVLQELMATLSYAVGLIPTSDDFKKKIDSAKTMFEIVGMLPAMLNAMGEASKTMNSEVSEIPQLNIDVGTLLGHFDNMVKFLIELAAPGDGGSRVEQLVTAIVNLGAALVDSRGRDITKTANKVKTFMEAVNSIGGAMSAFKGSAPVKLFGYNLVELQITAFIESLKTISTLPSKITGVLTSETIKEMPTASSRMETFTNNLRTINASTAGLTFNSKDLTAAIESYAALSKDETWISSVDKALGLSEADAASTSEINASTFPVVIAVQKLVAAANGIHSELENLNVGTVNTKLKALAKGLGLSNEKFDINLKGKVNVHLTLNVKMGAEELASKLEGVNTTGDGGVYDAARKLLGALVTP